MVHDWIIDVLTDLREFAGSNGLAVTEQQIDQALIAVADELASVQGIAQGAAHIGHFREFSRAFEASRNT